MQKQKQPSKQVLVAVLTGASLAALGALSRGNAESASSSQETSRKGGQERDDKVQMPVVIYGASLPSDPQELVLRRARGRRYDNRFPTPLNKLPHDTTEQLVIGDWWSGLPALPTAESDAVVLGEVVVGRAFLSNDETGAYSEFTIRIEEIFKGDGRKTVASGDSIIAEREGAAVQLPSGRVVRTGIAYQRMPRNGRRYVFFLKYNDDGSDYRIITGYELRSGRVIPLDGEVPTFRAYKEVDDSSFLAELRRAVLNPPPARQRKGNIEEI